MCHRCIDAEMHLATVCPPGVCLLGSDAYKQGLTLDVLRAWRDFFFKDFIYLFMRDTERTRDIGRGRSRLPAGTGNLMQDLIPGPWDHDLSQRQTLNH